jgi:uncharacterized DUF497 family protein
MIIKKVKISLKTKIKIYDKHGITMEEIKNTLLKNNPYYSKTKDGRYVALGKWNRFITIIFNYNLKYKEADIITSYPSSSWQVKLYKKKIK